MRTSWLTTQELASLLNVSIKTIRRAYRNGEIPIVRFRRMIRFDLDQIRNVVKQDGRRPSLRFIPVSKRSAIAGQGRRRARKSPRSVKRGRNF
jgi:excisionase family DNA binding protein